MEHGIPGEGGLEVSPAQPKAVLLFFLSKEDVHPKIHSHIYFPDF